MMVNPFDVINEKLDGLYAEIRALKKQIAAKPADEVGGMELAERVTGLGRGTIYKKVMKREIPHSKIGGRLYFDKVDLEEWIAGGRRKTIDEQAADMMAGKK